MAISSLLSCLLCGLPKREEKGEKQVSRTQYDIEGKNPGDSTDSQESIDSASQFTTPSESKKITIRDAITEIPIQPLKTNRALIVASKGTYAFADLPYPETIGDEEVVIENRATGLNPIDYKSVDYNFCLPEFPWVTGREMAGVVVKVGGSVRGLKEGDEVWTSTSPYHILLYLNSSLKKRWVELNLGLTKEQAHTTATAAQAASNTTSQSQHTPSYPFRNP